MDIYKEIFDFLKNEYSKGATYNDLAKKYGISYTHIHNLLSGRRSVSGISLEFFFKIFPKAQINLAGDVVSIHADHNSGHVVGVNRCGISSDCLSAVMDKILESGELSDAEKIKVMKVLKK